MNLDDPSQSDDAVILDDDHCLVPFDHSEDSHWNAAGWLFCHRIPVQEHQVTPGWCVGSVPRRNPTGPAWDVLSEDPITLAPSILCLNHNEHGYVRNGKWEGI